MTTSTRTVSKHGIVTISPGHEAGRANVRRYFGILTHILKGVMIATVVLAAAAACIAAARSVVGLDPAPARIAERLAAIDAMETTAMLLGLAIALTTGTPMGMYIHGLLFGYYDSPFDED